MDIRRRFLGIHEEGTATESNIIYYTTTTGSTITPYKTTGYGSNYIGSSYNDGVGTLVFDGPITKMPAMAFYNGSTLKSVLLPNTISNIGMEAFKGCINLESVVLPNSIRSISTSLFFGCKKLNSLDIPDSVTTIGQSVVRETEKLRTLIVPKNVSLIQSYFIYNTKLQNLYFKPTTPPTIYSDTLKLFTALNQTMPTLYVPNTALDAYKSATVWSNYTSYIRGYNA